MSDYELDPPLYKPICESYPAGADLLAITESDYIEFRKVVDGLGPSDAVGSTQEAAWKQAWQSQFQEFLEASEAKPAIYSGRDIIRPAVEPDWGRSWESGLELLLLTKDMRLMARLLLAGLSTGGPARMAAVCDNILHLVSGYWDQFHPLPAADDDHYERVAPLKQALENPGFTRVLNSAILYHSPRIGPITSRFIDVALGGAEKREGEFALDRAGFEQFLDDEPAAKEGLADAGRSAAAAARYLVEIEAVIDSHPGSFPIKAGVAADALQQLAAKLAPYAPTVDEDTVSNVEVSDDDIAVSNEGMAPLQTATEEIRINGIESKLDALANIRAVRVYLADHVPSSPIALLLGQVEGMFGASFPDLVKLIAPDGPGDPALYVNINDPAAGNVPLGGERFQAAGALDDLAAILAEIRQTRQGNSEAMRSLIDRGEGAVETLQRIIGSQFVSAPSVPVIDSHAKARAALVNVASYMERAEPSHPSAPFLHRIAGLIGQDFVSLLRELMPQGADAIKLGLALPGGNEE